MMFAFTTGEASRDPADWYSCGWPLPIESLSVGVVKLLGAVFGRGTGPADHPAFTYERE